MATTLWATASSRRTGLRRGTRLTTVWGCRSEQGLCCPPTATARCAGTSQREPTLDTSPTPDKTAGKHTHTNTHTHTHTHTEHNVVPLGTNPFNVLSPLSWRRRHPESQELFPPTSHGKKDYKEHTIHIYTHTIHTTHTYNTYIQYTHTHNTHTLKTH